MRKGSRPMIDKWLTAHAKPPVEDTDPSSTRATRSIDRTITEINKIFDITFAPKPPPPRQSKPGGFRGCPELHGHWSHGLCHKVQGLIPKYGMLLFLWRKMSSPRPQDFHLHIYFQKTLDQWREAVKKAVLIGGKVPNVGGWDQVVPIFFKSLFLYIFNPFLL